MLLCNPRTLKDKLNVIIKINFKHNYISERSNKISTILFIHHKCDYVNNYFSFHAKFM